MSQKYGIYDLQIPKRSCFRRKQIVPYNGEHKKAAGREEEAESQPSLQPRSQESAEQNESIFESLERDEYLASLVSRAFSAYLHQQDALLSAIEQKFAFLSNEVCKTYQCLSALYAENFLLNKELVELENGSSGRELRRLSKSMQACSSAVAEFEGNVYELGEECDTISAKATAAQHQRLEERIQKIQLVIQDLQTFK